MPRPMMFLAAHAPDGLLAPVGLLGTSHRFLFKIGGRNNTLAPGHGQTAPWLYGAVVAVRTRFFRFQAARTILGGLYI